MKEKKKGLMKKADILMNLRGYQQEETHKEKGIVDIIASKPETEEKVLVRVVTRSQLKSDTIGTGQVRKMEKTLEKMGVDKGVLIGKRFSSTARREMLEEGIEGISEKSLPPFNIFTHYLVPKHEILTPEEAREVLTKYRIKPYRLPHIKRSDPAARAIGAKPGDIIKVTRKSPTAGSTIVYRYVVS